jgi:LPXTG-motif cell wall-anchored protein
VLVPTGGIGDVQIGIRGFADGRPSDLLFPITNDPLPGVGRVAAPTSRQASPDEPGTGSTTWIFIVAAGGLTTLALFAVALMRRRNASAGASASPGA